MPVPTPHSDEDEKHFMERCMTNEKMMAEFPEHQQRLAICLGRYGDHKKSKNKDKAQDRFSG